MRVKDAPVTLMHPVAATVRLPPIRAKTTAAGAVLLEPVEPLASYPAHVGVWLRHWADRTPQAPCIAERDDDGNWTARSYVEMRGAVDRAAQWLLDNAAGGPLAVLSDKGIDHAVLSLAAQQAGVPVAPISEAYSLRPEARRRLRHVLQALQPTVVYAKDGATFGAALAEARSARKVLVSSEGPSNAAAVPFADLLQTHPGPRVEEAFSRVGTDDIAKIMFTSGSTDWPKPVINTHGNICSNQQALRQVLPFLTASPPVLVDWQPWHHCGGGNFNFYACLANGGTYHCDAGKPLQGGMDASERNLLAVSPTLYINVPYGYAKLAERLETNPRLRRRFFQRLRLMIYSGASMSEKLWRRLKALAADANGQEVPLASAYGMTEMAPLHTFGSADEEMPGRIGTPIPGSVLKLVPKQGRYELRAAGPNVTPGYFRRADLTAAAFDDDGYFLSGDCVSPVSDDWQRGLVYEGRLTGQFKLNSGTFVPVDEVRDRALHFLTPLVDDVVVVGENRDEVGLLAFLNEPACAHSLGEPEAPRSSLVRDKRLMALIRTRLERHNAVRPGSSRRIGRVLLLDESPDFHSEETTHKGTLNQRQARERRQALVVALYGPPKGAAIIVPDATAHST